MNPEMLKKLKGKVPPKAMAVEIGIGAAPKKGMIPEESETMEDEMTESPEEQAAEAAAGEEQHPDAAAISMLKKLPIELLKEELDRRMSEGEGSEEPDTDRYFQDADEEKMA